MVVAVAMVVYMAVRVAYNERVVRKIVVVKNGIK